MREKIKYICQTEERKFLEKNPAERNREREREMKMQSARGPSCLVLRKPYPTRTKKIIVFKVFIFF